MERVLGPDHPNTLTTRGNLAESTAATGGAAGALRLFLGLLPDRERVLGPDHPVILTTRAFIAALTGAAGDPAGALRMFQELLPDMERMLGPDHPETLAAWRLIAYWTSVPAEGLALARRPGARGPGTSLSCCPRTSPGSRDPGGGS